ncbi:MAG: hypothetical protein JM58_09110 [Peptococcaceae bacterium BICA1-8]|nr:MAG: hypothetical protein JM58_09110 [Peptococcaceae bacterium BICA1-8]
MAGQALRNVVEELISTNSASEDYYCTICGRLVPKLHLTILKKDRVIQPKCKCESDQHDNFFKEIAEKKRKSDIEAKFSISELGDRFNNCRLNNFILRPGAAGCYELAKAYADKFSKQTEKGLVIWGRPGNGKSHLAVAIAHEVIKRNHTVVFRTMPELLEKIRNSFNRDSKDTEQQIMSALIDCNLLILDDFGAEKINDWVADVIFRIVDRRYRLKRPIIVTTNYSPQELVNNFDKNMLDIKGLRVIDRILETNSIIENKATSYRQEIAKKNKMAQSKENLFPE